VGIVDDTEVQTKFAQDRLLFAIWPIPRGCE
jgi:hypothetical protein